MAKALKPGKAKSKRKARAADARPLAILGPTASGKSALALVLAEKLGGQIINADASQLYRDLRILTARPSVEEEARAPHRLYGVLGASEVSSAGSWRTLALKEIAACQAQGQRPILVGGSGLYLKALEEGLAPIPPIAPEIAEEARARLEEVGLAPFREELLALDPRAEQLAAGDSQRHLRAWMVLRATGRSLFHWQEEAKSQGLALDYIVLLPARDDLRQAVARRFHLMIESGALDEVKALLELYLDPSLPIMKAVGVRELQGVLEGRHTLEDAAEAAITATRQYLKRQTTWLRTQLLARRTDAIVWEKQFSERDWDEIFPFLCKKGLTG